MTRDYRDVLGDRWPGRGRTGILLCTTCALLALLLLYCSSRPDDRLRSQTQPRYSPYMRGRTSLFLLKYRRLKVSTSLSFVEALPTILHLSLFRFFASPCISVRRWQPIPNSTLSSCVVLHFRSTISHFELFMVGSITYLDSFSAESYFHFQRSNEDYHFILFSKFLAQGIRKRAKAWKWKSPDSRREYLL